MTIKVLEKVEGCMPRISDNGEWIDLFTAEDVVLKAPFAATLQKKKKENEVERTRKVFFNNAIINLGVAMKLPKGYEAVVAPRSSTFKKWRILQNNSLGVIDNSYCGNDDVWRMPVVATMDVTIPKGTRLCQFRVQLSQKATVLQKLKWLFTSSVKLKKVQNLSDNNRGGFGTSGN